MKLFKTINLIKYSNRKLYSPSGELYDKGAYVTLKTVEETLKKGNEVVIRDKQGNDITNEVLTQVLANKKLKNSDLIKLIRN